MFKKLLILVTVLAFPVLAFAQSGSLTGTVTDSETGESLPGATIMLVELNRGTASDIQGRFTLDNVPAGTYTLRVSFVGYSRYQTSVSIGTTATTVDVALNPDRFGLDEIVVTGVLGDTEARRTPFTVGRVTSRDLEMVPSVTPASALRGKVPGVSIVQGSGQPGSAPSVVLRGITSISESNAPLYIVDGVILGASNVDIESLDIESIEVVKGAAAASLYGSRAANGVINIRTKRGANLTDGTTRITVRNEYGFSSLENKVGVNMSHPWATSGDPNAPWLDDDGNPTDDPTERVVRTGNTYTTFLDEAYPVETFDNIDRFFNPGDFYTNYVSIAQRVGNVNYMASFNNTRQQGVLDALDGYQRRNVRLNIDSRLYDNLTLSASGYYATSSLDQIQTGPGSPFFGLAFTAPDIDLDRRDPDTGRYLIQPNPASIEENPLYEVTYNNRTDDRTRVLGSFEARFTPVENLELTGNFSYDRSNREFTRFWPEWWEQIDQNLYEGGGLLRATVFDEAVNASFNVSYTHDFGKLRTRTQGRYLTENAESKYFDAEGRNFTVAGVPTLGNTDNDRQFISSSQTTVRSEGFYFGTNLDYDGKYIFDTLVRRDGSSLFGPDERWHTYYRLSAAYLINEEDWFDVQGIDELKINASLGTAGGRPRFSAQYETLNIAGDAVTKATLGNRDLKPEFAREIELGFEIGFLRRFLFNFTYAETKTEDQLLLVPLVSIFGFSSQWQNAGTVESSTYEASLRAFAIQQRDLSLSFNLLFDRSISTITEFNRPAQRYGPGTQASSVFYRRAGERVGAFYGIKWVENASQLPPDLADYASYFDRNDDGYFVPVGEGNSWRDGVSEDLWGSTVELPDGSQFDWGHPIRMVNEDGVTDLTKLGNALPDFSLSFSTNFRYKNFTLFAMFDGQFGGEIYNQTRQWAFRDYMHPDQDAAGKADHAKKPLNYYQHLYAQNNTNSHFVEDGSYIKLRELAVRYTFDSEQLRPLFGNAVHRITVSAIGRNLLTFTNYSGFDPEVGAGDATILRFDGFNYPNFRTFTGSIEFQF
jgi:TonB-linked SusC/RagA family outer membrane protein